MRQTIVDKITDALKTIKTSTGYITNAGNNVKEWAFVSEVSPETVLQVRDVSCTAQQSTVEDNVVSAWFKRLELKVIYVASESLSENGLASATLRNIIKDVFMAFKSIDYPEEVYNVGWTSDEMIGSQNSQKYVGISISMFVDYTTDEFTD